MCVICRILTKIHVLTEIELQGNRPMECYGTICASINMFGHLQ